jgi:hypothetical protein
MEHTPEQIRDMLMKVDDNGIKELLFQGNLTVDPYDRDKAINKISGLSVGCDTCDQKANKKYASVTYVNGSEKQDCKNCNK